MNSFTVVDTGYDRIEDVNENCRLEDKSIISSNFVDRKYKHAHGDCRDFVKQDFVGLAGLVEVNECSLQMDDLKENCCCFNDEDK